MSLSPSLPAAPFSGIEPDETVIAKVLQKPMAERRLVIHFTPRSSSTRLTEILAATKAMGHANEVFNPAFVGRVARNWKVADINLYTQFLPRQHVVGGVWSCEVTAHHLDYFFPNDLGPFLEITRPAISVWLIRRDIVAQAVSLAKMVSTKVGHSFLSGADDLRRADAEFVYDKAEILRWLQHVRMAELRSEQIFQRHGIAPLRLCYEDLICRTPQQIVDLLTDHAGWPSLPGQPDEDSGLANQKIGTDKNIEFAVRFRAEAARLVARIEADRAPMLARLYRPDQPVPGPAALCAEAAQLPPVLRRHDRLRLRARQLALMLRSRFQQGRAAAVKG